MSAPDNQIESALRDPRRNVEINLGKACNHNCVFCLDGVPSKEDKSFMPFEQLCSELRRWREEGHLSVGFLGGEPTTHPQIVQAVAYARELGFTRIAVATNAMMFRREKFVDRMVDAGLTRTTISMHGHTQELEERLTGVPGGYAKKLQAIANLQARQRQGALRDGISVNIVLNGWNYRALPKMMRFFYEEVGLIDLRVNFVRPEGYAEANSSLTPTYTEVIPVLMKAVLLNQHHFKQTFTFGGIPMCVLPLELLNSERLLAHYMGDIYRDLSTDCSIRADGPFVDGVSRVEDGRARFNWQDRKRFDLKHHIQTCGSCDLAETCEGVWRGYLDIYGPDEFAAVRPERGKLRRSQPYAAVAPKPSPHSVGVVVPRSGQR